MTEDEIKNSTLGEIGVHFGYLRQQLTAIQDKLDKMSDHYVTKEEFTPVKNLVYGLVSTILLSAFGAILSLIYK